MIHKHIVVGPMLSTHTHSVTSLPNTKPPELRIAFVPHVRRGWPGHVSVQPCERPENTWTTPLALIIKLELAPFV